jgi:ferritin-like metal-binding protein YciE
MTIKNPRELFVLMLSDLRQGTERTTEIFQEIGQSVPDPDIREALEARVFIAENVIATLDQCFTLIGEQPVKWDARLQDVFLEDFRKQLAEIQNPVARRIFVLAQATRLLHLRIAEYIALLAAADLSGHYAVGVLLESCLADKVAFAERTRRLIQSIAQAKLGERRAVRPAA